MILQDHCRWQLSGQYIHQTFIILTHHLNIQIIVPGDKATMTNCTYQSTATQPITYAMFLAYSVYFAQ